MRVEILCTGNELLDGSIVDSNSAWIEAELFKLGLEVAEKRVVPDDLEVITHAMQEIAARADFCITSGGLGPTPDDLTAEALARAAGVRLIEHAPTAERLRAWMESRGRTYGPSQSRQAQVPEGATVLRNEVGSAPHIQLTLGRCTFALLPGVPSEFQWLSERYVIPRIAERFAAERGGEHFAFTQLRCVGLWEADMAWAVRELPARHPGLRLGTRTAYPENHLKLRAAGATAALAASRLAAAVDDARERLGKAVYAVGDLSFAAATLAKLRAEGATAALAESLTGGLAASMLAEVPGASEVLLASYVAYTPAAKIQMLGLDPGLIEREGVVSEAVAREMALAARARAQATYGVSVTGWAGPDGGTERDPVGTFYAALATPAGVTVARHTAGRASRERVRKGAAWAALDLLRTATRA